MKLRSNINRRGFLKGTSAVAAFFSMPKFSFAEAKSKLTEVITAAHWGPLKVTVKDGKIVSSVPALKQNYENSLQKVVADQVYTKARVKAPMVRKGYLENPGNPDNKRGKDEFVEVSWDKAYSLIEKELKRCYSDFGSESIFAGSYGWRSSGALHKAYTLMHRFLELQGGFTGHRGDYSTGASQVIMPHVVGTIEVYDVQTSWTQVLDHAETVVLWGMNPFNTLRIAWTVSDGTGLEYIRKLKESGKKVIIIDPIVSNTVKFFGDKAEHIRPLPSTDVPVMLAMAHTMITDNLHDKEFLDKYTSGYDKFEEYVLGKTDNTPKTPEWAAKISGLDVEVIKKTIKSMASSKTMIMSGWGMQRQHHGEQAHWTLFTLASMIGQIGKPGTGVGLSYHSSNGGNPGRKSVAIQNITAGVKSGSLDWEAGAGVTIPVARIADALQNPGKEIDHNGEKIKYPEIKMVWWCGGNPFHHHQDLNQLRRAWQKPNTVIVNEPYWTATAKHADIVLPVTTSYERNDISMTGSISNMHLTPMKKVVEPQFLAKDDFTIFTDLAERFGIKDKFTEGRSEIRWLKYFYDQAQESAKSAGIRMPSFKEFWDKNQIIEFAVDPKKEKFNRYQDFIEDPLVNPVGTPSGKIEIYSKTIEKMGYDDCKAHPMWLEPIEYLGNATEEHPFHVISPHLEYRLHSQLNYTSLRDEYAVANREPILINPKDAESRGIKDGDVVRVFNKRGQALAGAVVTEDTLPGILVLHEGAWYDPSDDSDYPLCKNGCINTLTIDIPTSKLANGNCGHTAIANIEKFTEQAPELTAFTPPKITKI